MLPFNWPGFPVREFILWSCSVAKENNSLLQSVGQTEPNELKYSLGDFWIV